MNFQFMRTESYLDSIDISDIGNVTLNMFTDEGVENYLDIKTNLGWTIVKKFGPLNVDSDELNGYFSFTYFNFEFNEKRIKKVIQDFLRDATQVFEITTDDFTERLDNI